LAYRPHGGKNPVGPEGGEGGREAASRLENCVLGIAERFEFSGGHIALFTHPMALAALYARLTEGESRSFRDGDALRLVYQDDRFTIKE
ncbi:histidine phosphatase family protein, partial [Desulfovibrio sp. OttesenSCG-928-I05]|nr:histidine phosphatase family protein [Desulfovibrio sp. OttesenSCG-928-I05]